MRINTTRLGLILLILGSVLLFNFWAAPLPQSAKVSIGEVDPGETLSYSLFMAPVGLGNFVVGGETITTGAAQAVGPIRIEIVLPIHLVIVSPSNETLVDVDVVAPHTVQINFNERGEYIVHATNMGDERSPIPVALEFPRDSDVVNREADKFFVSLILTVSGAALFCLGLSISLISKYKRVDVKTVDTSNQSAGPQKRVWLIFDYYFSLNRR
ncbi:MAG: hypothetical protein FWB84_05775 [Candidatus Bathyarchaeota archaeon]|uniref:hypothetical protein n=1 Tax=Candidatus Bathycorpusculum sp. TaxID=2994959 RepID=UPI0028376ECF|nr:hypothetical protein [Candidatus Termiticorpusculum sp.]MCL2291859.1 hypothetical protein [Candidatus Termiticorpusculum sp.]